MKKLQLTWQKIVTIINKDATMYVFASSDYGKQFAEIISKRPGFAMGKADITRFPNGEMQATLHSNVAGEDCVVVGTTAPPDSELLSLCMLANALKHSDAHRVFAVIPYLGYARHDKPKPNESAGIKLIGAFLKNAGINAVIALDVHSALDHKQLGIPLTSISSAELFAHELSTHGWHDATPVAPDVGAITRADRMAKALGTPHKMAHFVKQHTDGIVLRELIGDVSPQVVLVDDILDTSRTLVSVCEELQERGVEEIVVAVTHGVFSNDNWRKLFDLGVQKIYVTNTYHGADHDKVEQLSIEPLCEQIVDVIKQEQKR